MSYPPHSGMKFPVEIVEAVVDHSDTSVLRQFALTCRDLIPRSRYHLFSGIQFQAAQQDVESLCRFLDNNRLLADIVRTATILPPQHFPSAESFVHVFPAGLLRRIPNLRHWRLLTSGARSPMAPLSFHTTALTFLRTTTRIQILDIQNLNFTSHAELARLLASFTLLRDLRCSNVQSRNENMVVGPIQRRRHRSLRSLHVRGP